MQEICHKLRHIGRHPSTLKGFSGRFTKIKALILASQSPQGVTKDIVYVISQLLRSLSIPRVPDLSIFTELYVMSVHERQGIYKSTPDPHIEVELLGPSVGDAVFCGMQLILRESYGLRVEEPGKYKWRILRGNAEVGSLTYDEKDGHRIPRLRAKLTGRTIAFCPRAFGLVVETKIHFNPSRMREQIRAEVMPVLRQKEEEFIGMLKTKPSDFLKGLETFAGK